MSDDQEKPKTIDEYIAGYSGEVRERLEGIRRVVREAAPDATEAIKYGMPTYVQGENLLSFGAYKNHIGFYPIPDVSGDEGVETAVATYRGAKSTLRFRYDEPVPYELIGALVKLRLKDVLDKAAAKGK